MYPLSVVVPVLNEEYYLERLLRNLSAQKGVLLDIIVADAGSKDKSREIAQKYGARVVEGGKPPVGRNNGVPFAKYREILFLDADVDFHENFVCRCLDDMKKKRLVVATVLTNPESDRMIDRVLFDLWNFWVWTTQKIYPHACGCCIFSHADIHKKIGGFDPNLTLGEDSNYALKASNVCRFGVLDKEINMSVRRLDTEGRAGMLKKMILCGLYRIFIGEPRGNMFNYHFNHKRMKVQ